MTATCTMSEFNLPFTSSMVPYSMGSNYITSAPMPPMEQSPPADMARAGYQSMPPSPSSSTGSHRVSKAKKGKRVHVCEFAGCSKVFTRAEHRRRHELSHKNKKLYTCTVEGCTKAFHRSDYLSQHLARHDPHTSVVATPPARSTSVSSSSHFPSESPVASAFHSVPAHTQIEQANNPESPLLASNYYDEQTRHGSCSQAQPMYSYPSAEQSPLQSAHILPAQCLPSQIPTGFETFIDQYIRNVLKPEVFLSSPESIPSQSPQTVSSTYWTANIDPQLPPLNPMGFDNSTYSSWTPGAESLPTPVQSIRDLTETSRS